MARSHYRIAMVATVVLTLLLAPMAGAAVAQDDGMDDEMSNDTDDEGMDDEMNDSMDDDEMGDEEDEMGDEEMDDEEDEMDDEEEMDDDDGFSPGIETAGLLIALLGLVSGIGYYYTQAS